MCKQFALQILNSVRINSLVVALSKRSSAWFKPSLTINRVMLKNLLCTWLADSSGKLARTVRCILITVAGVGLFAIGIWLGISFFLLEKSELNLAHLLHHFFVELHLLFKFTLQVYDLFFECLVLLLDELILSRRGLANRLNLGWQLNPITLQKFEHT